MTKKCTIPLHPASATILGALLALSSLFAQSTEPKTPAPSQSKPISGTSDSKAEGKPAKKAKKPGDEGIAVHGHWTITVRNADGSIAQKRDFENSLNTSTGETGLLALLAGQSAVGDLAIGVAGGPDVCATGAGDTCLSVISTGAGIGGQLCASNAALCSSGLSETVSQSGNGNVTVTGLIPVVQTAAISSVETILLLCNGTAGTYTTITPAACFALAPGAPNITSSTYTLTAATLGTPLGVSAGQTVSIAVVLTFS